MPLSPRVRIPHRLVAAAFIAVLSGCAEAPPVPVQAAAPVQAPAWAAQTQAAIAAGEYAPRQDGAAFRATNRAQGLDVVFTERGLSVSSRVGPGRVSLALQAWGREGAVVPAESVPPDEGACVGGGAVDPFGACVRRVEFARPGLTEWWANAAGGLEQGFTVTSPPDGEGALVFDLALTGARVDVADGEALLRRPSGDPLRYAGVVAWDERGRELPAWLDGAEDGLRITVDDAGAIGVVTVDPLLTLAAWTVDGGQGFAALGASVASAGDVNGDGFGDVVVGAPGDGEANEGRAYLYLGGAAGLATTAAWAGEADQADASFGSSVASAGDVNGDGFGDVVVGAPTFTARAAREGAAFLYFGSPSGLASSAAWSAATGQANASFGASVASAGDVNADGYADLVVGAPGYDNGESDEGRVYVYLGSPSGPRAPWHAEADQPDARFGISVASAGDVDGDGYSDVVVGADAYDNGEVDEGRALVFLGSASGLSTSAAWTAEPDQASAAFGCAVASAGDVNGDGYGDVVVGANTYDNGETDEGRTSVYLGAAAGLSASAAWTAESDQASAMFGSAVASAGDVNGDGYGDVVVGAPYDDTGSPAGGRASVYLGGASGPATSPTWTAESGAAGAHFAAAVAGAGDVNGDGYGDVLVGAPEYDGAAREEGRAKVFLGAASGLSTSAGWFADGAASTVLFGWAAASAGDVNGDGYGDVVVAGLYSAASYVYLGSASGLAAAASWSSSGDCSGGSVASAGDVDGDGYGDLVEGDPYGNKACVYLGSAAGLATRPAWTAETDQGNSRFGSSVASAGDVNGDGYGDVVVGAFCYDYRGRAYVYLGSASGLASSPAWMVTTTGADYLGYSVASAGDVNGDGYGDVVVGAPQYDNGGMHVGRVSVYLGSSSGLATSATWAVESNQGSSFFGGSVASAGDVNGDGYGDLVVGATHYRTRSGRGKVFVYLGGASGPDSRPAWTVDSDDTSDASGDLPYFGWSVASAGDVNGDGYGDVTIGAYRYTGVDLGVGKAFVYLGSASGLARHEDWAVEGDQDYAFVGSSVTSAGDVNGDGYGDLLVGAARYSGAYTDAGRAYVYLGNSADGTTPRSLGLQARQPGSATPIAPGLQSTSASAFDVAVFSARGAWGRGKVQLQVEAKPLGTAFDGSGLSAAASYADAGLDGVALQQQVSGLTSATAYHWRARVRVSPAEGRPQGWGPWVYGGRSGDSPGGHVFTAGLVTVYLDRDGDGYGDSATAVTMLGVPSGYVRRDADCDDGDAAVNPGAAEIAGDESDSDCDGVELCYIDADGDGYRPNPLSTVVSLDLSCGDAGEASSADRPGDCDDADAGIHPLAIEVPGDGLDQNCDGIEICYLDADGDGWIAAGEPTVVSGDADCDDAGEATSGVGTGDCDDADSSVNPSEVDEIGDGRDGNCDGIETCFADGDGDGWRPDATSTVLSADGDCDDPGEALDTELTGDCDDVDVSYHPGAPESDCADPNDYNCDGSIGYTDADGDGCAACADCDDANPAALPHGSELPGDGIDGDCDGVDLCYVDADGDGYRATPDATVTGTTLACNGAGETNGMAATGDCDDADARVHPTAREVVDDATDEDCDGGELCLVDGDGDGYRPDGDATVDSRDLGCSGAGEASAIDPAGDCDDFTASVHPGAPETDCSDHVDYNCDGSAGRADADRDGYAACEECDDAHSAVNPSAAEVPADAVDGNCDGLEACFVDADGDGVRPDEVTTVASPDLRCDGAGEAPATAPFGDCDDGDRSVCPGASEICDGLDDDCDGSVDLGAIDAPVWYADADGDGFTDAAVSVSECEPPAGYAAATDPPDCDDGDAAAHPGAADVPDDGIDQDCDGRDASGGETGDTDSGGTDSGDTGETAEPDSGGRDTDDNEGKDTSGANGGGGDSASADSEGGKPGPGCGCASGEGVGAAWLLVAMAACFCRGRGGPLADEQVASRPTPQARTTSTRASL